MAEDKKRFSDPVKCGHCRNVAPMEVIGGRSGVVTYSHGTGLFEREWDAGTVWELLECPACNGVILRSSHYHSEFVEEGQDWVDLYPSPHAAPVGLPENIQQAYDGAIAVRSIDSNLFGVALRRILELVCLDKNASKGDLAKSIRKLASDGHVPEKIADLADKLRHLGNVGTHPTLGELSTRELPIIEKLCRAVLEYVYTAPKLVEDAEKSLRRAKKKKAAKKKAKKTKKKST